MSKARTSLLYRSAVSVKVSDEIRSEIVRKSIHVLVAFVPFFAGLNVSATLFMLGGGIIL